MECGYCGENNGDDSKYCIHCDAYLQPLPPKPNIVKLPLYLKLFQMFLNNNIFYLLSAFFMLLGCYSMMRFSVSKENYSLHALMILQSYEILIIGVTVLLFRCYKVFSDVMLLSLIEFTLILDPTFFNSIFYWQDLQRGIIINGICFAMIPLKLLLLTKVARVPISFRTIMTVGLTALFIYTAPIVFYMNISSSSVSKIYSLYCWAPFLILLFAPELRNFSARDGSSETGYGEKARFNMTRYTVLIAVAVLYNRISGMIYINQPGVIFGHFAAPVLLTMCLVFIKLFSGFTKKVNGVVVYIFVFVAILLSTDFSRSADIKSLGFITPYRLILLASLLIFVKLHTLLKNKFDIIGMILCGLLYSVGSNFSEVRYLLSKPSASLIVYGIIMSLVGYDYYRNYVFAMIGSAFLSIACLRVGLVDISGEYFIFIQGFVLFSLLFLEFIKPRKSAFIQAGLVIILVGSTMIQNMLMPELLSYRSYVLWFEIIAVISYGIAVHRWPLFAIGMSFALTQLILQRETRQIVALPGTLAIIISLCLLILGFFLSRGKHRLEEWVQKRKEMYLT